LLQSAELFLYLYTMEVMEKGNAKDQEEKELYAKINKETGLSKEQVKNMEVKQLNSYLKSQNIPKNIKSDIGVLRRRLRNRNYARTKREKDDSSSSKLEKAILEMEKRIEEYENVTKNNVETVTDIALEKTYPKLLPKAKKYINQEILGEDRENLIHHINEIERIRKWRSEAKEYSNKIEKLQEKARFTAVSSNSSLVLEGGAILENVETGSRNPELQDCQNNKDLTTVN